jgi:hypothetical protein
MGWQARQVKTHAALTRVLGGDSTLLPLASIVAIFTAAAAVADGFPKITGSHPCWIPLKDLRAAIQSARKVVK